MWFLLFCTSMVLNVFLFFYIKWLFKSLEAINQDIQMLTEKINIFAGHLSSLHEMEMFYGDQTLQSLLRHATELSDDLNGLDLILNEEPQVEEVPQSEA